MFFPLSIHHLGKGTKGRDTMKHEQKVANLERHLQEHPTDYQAVIAHLKARSDAIEHRAWLRMIERKKRLAEVRRMRKERQNVEEH